MSVKDYGDFNHPIFKTADGKTPISDGNTLLAYCPRCDAVLIKYRQDKCQECGKEIDWS